MVQFDERHLNFILERVFEQIQSRIRPGGEIQIVHRGVTSEENWENLELWYEEQKAKVYTFRPGIHPSEEQDFEDLSLGLGLARRIMRKNNGEMSVIQEDGGRTRILLRFQGGKPSRSEF